MTDDRNDDGTTTDAAHERDAAPSTPLSEQAAVQRDTAYSPASETETQRKQADPLPDAVDGDIDADDVRAVPGTGGPDDVGDVDVAPEDLNLPWKATS